MQVEHFLLYTVTVPHLSTADLSHLAADPHLARRIVQFSDAFPGKSPQFVQARHFAPNRAPNSHFGRPNRDRVRHKMWHTKSSTADLSHVAADPHLARRIVQFSETFPGKSPQFVQARQFAPNRAPNSHFGRPNRDRVRHKMWHTGASNRPST